ncbi:MAG: protein TolQ [Pseudomonadota bacterium]|nr:protein TolQ [Pseudomonadota bacterium]HJO36297.1 protein TolQ [Gammaproteobacteria bacterium]
MPAEVSIFALISAAGPVVKLVMLLLMMASVYSWYLIITKAVDLRRARQENARFEERFWSGGDLADLYRNTSRDRDRSVIGELFIAGFGEFARLREKGSVPADERVTAGDRAMRAAQLRELEALQAQLPTLATIGSTSPYVGLFGTVWGIMTAFQALAGVQQATLNVVAPGIAEALIATAMGLVAAIPAVVAYNRFSASLAGIDATLDSFRDEFANILQRNAVTGRSESPAGAMPAAGL